MKLSIRWFNILGDIGAVFLNTLRVRLALFISVNFWYILVILVKRNKMAEIHVFGDLTIFRQEN